MPGMYGGNLLWAPSFPEEAEEIFASAKGKTLPWLRAGSLSERHYLGN